MRCRAFTAGLHTYSTTVYGVKTLCGTFYTPVAKRKTKSRNPHTARKAKPGKAC